MGDKWFEPEHVEAGEFNGTAQDLRELYGDLIIALRTGEPGRLSYPPVRELLACKIEVALATEPNEVSKALGITRSVGVRQGLTEKQKKKAAFSRWYSKQCSDMGNEPTEIMIDDWFDDNYDKRDGQRGVDLRTIQRWKTAAKSLHNLFGDIAAIDQCPLLSKSNNPENDIMIFDHGVVTPQ